MSQPKPEDHYPDIKRAKAARDAAQSLADQYKKKADEHAQHALKLEEEAWGKPCPASPTGKHSVVGGFARFAGSCEHCGIEAWD